MENGCRSAALRGSKVMEELKRQQACRYHAISAYSRHDYRVIAESGFDAAQYPMNVFDWTQIENGGMEALEKSGMMVFVRSVFLQGLVFHTPEDLDPRMDFCRPYNGYESIIELGSAERHELTLDFPLYSEVKELYIGLDKNGIHAIAPEYKHTLPIVYYGSSITQGGCASRPGNAYPAMISRELNWDFINLGFSGNAKGEPEIAEYISRLPMAMFVYDYDHNAPNPDHLRNTHEAMYQTIRTAHPNISILMLTMPKKEPRQTEELWEREQVICATYKKAKDRGDRNVYFLTGTELLGEAAQAATVDNCHPNDMI